MDCGNLSAVDPLHLPLQMTVFRCLCQTAAQCLHDFGAQLGGRLFGVCDDQKVIHIAGMHRVADPCQKPLHQHHGLTGTGGSRDQHGTAAVIHNRLLAGG